MNKIEAYETFTAMNLHWTTSYDFVKFKGKVRNISVESFEKRSDKYTFISIAKKFSREHFILYLIPQYLHYGTVSIHGLTSEINKQIANDWYRKIQKLPVVFQDDVDLIIKYIIDKKINLEIFFKGEGIINFLIDNKINIETFIILSRMIKFLDKSNNYSIIYRTMFEMKVEKYQSFITADIIKYKNIFKERLKKSKEVRMQS